MRGTLIPCDPDWFDEAFTEFWGDLMVYLSKYEQLDLYDD